MDQRVLLVEDDASIREVVALALQARGTAGHDGGGWRPDPGVRSLAKDGSRVNVVGIPVTLRA